MDVVFKSAFNFVMENEGGGKVVSHKDDPGGVTKYGISKKAFPELDIPNLTEEDAQNICYEHYWKKMCLDQLNFNDLAIPRALLDLAYWHGVQAATKMCQKALNGRFLYNKPLAEDGVMGPKTLDMLSRVCNDLLFSSWFVSCLKYVALMRCVDLVVANPSLNSFMKGWKNRIDRYI